MSTTFTEINDNVTDAGDLVSSEVFSVIADNLNHLADAMPVGSIVPIITNWPAIRYPIAPEVFLVDLGYFACPPPDPTIWQLCDGSLITEPNSPLFGQNTPDFATEGLYMRGYATLGAIGTIGGANYKDLSHDHGGVTSTFSPPTVSENGGSAQSPTQHFHYLREDLLAPVAWMPSSYVFNHYIKIR